MIRLPLTLILNSKSRGPDPQRRFKEGPNKTGRTGLLKCVNCRKHRVRVSFHRVIVDFQCELQTFDLNIACKRCEEKGWRCSDEDKQFSCHREKQLVAQGLLNPPILPSLAVFKELIPGRDGVYMAILSSKKDIPQFYSLRYLPTLQLAALTPLLQSAWLIFLSRICDRSFQDLRRYKSFFIKFWQDTLNKAAVDERVVSEVLLANYIAGSSDFIYGSLYGRFLDSSPISEQLTNTLQFSRCCRALMARGIASQKMQSEAVLMWMCLASGSLLWLRASNLSPEVTLSGLDILKESLNNMSSLLLTQNSQNGEPSRTVAKDVGFAGQLQMGIHLNAGYLGVQICLDRHFYHQRCSKVSLNAFLPQSNALLGRMISLCIELEGSWGWTLDSSEADILLQISRGGFPRFIRLGRSTSRTRSLLLVILRELFAPNKSGNSKTGERELTAREAALQLYKIFFSDGHCTCSSQMFLFWVGIMLRPPVFQSRIICQKS